MYVSHASLINFHETRRRFFFFFLRDVEANYATGSFPTLQTMRRSRSRKQRLDGQRGRKKRKEKEKVLDKIFMFNSSKGSEEK